MYVISCFRTESIYRKSFQESDLMDIIEQQTQHLPSPEEAAAAAAAGTSNTPGKENPTPVTGTT